MSNYFLNATSKEMEISSLDCDNAFVLNFHHNSDGIKSISIYDNCMKNDVAIKRFTKSYANYLKRVKCFFEDDDETEDGLAILLDEVVKLKELLNDKYKKFIKKREYEYFLCDIEDLRETLLEEINKLKKSHRR